MFWKIYKVIWFDLHTIWFNFSKNIWFDNEIQFGFNLIFDSAAIEPSTKAIWTESSFLFIIFFKFHFFLQDVVQIYLIYLQMCSFPQTNGVDVLVESLISNCS